MGLVLNMDRHKFSPFGHWKFEVCRLAFVTSFCRGSLGGDQIKAPLYNSLERVLQVAIQGVGGIVFDTVWNHVVVDHKLCRILQSLRRCQSTVGGMYTVL